MLNVTGMPDVVDQTFLVIQHCSPIFRLVKFSLSNHVHTKRRDFQTSIEAKPLHHYGCLLDVWGVCDADDVSEWHSQWETHSKGDTACCYVRVHYRKL